jgi:hypothetical protein
VYPAVVENLRLWAEYLAVFRTKVRRPITVELDAVS